MTLNTINKKVLNAKFVLKNGILFRSKLESYCSDILTTNGFDFKYEEVTYTLQERLIVQQPVYKPRKVKGKKTKQLVQISQISLPITYTPDFLIEKNDMLFIIECKGMETDTFKLKIKLFKKYIHENKLNCVYMTPSTKTQVRQCISIINQYKTE